MSQYYIIVFINVLWIETCNGLYMLQGNCQQKVAPNCATCNFIALIYCIVYRLCISWLQKARIVLQDNVLYGSKDNAYKIWGCVALLHLLSRSSTFHIERAPQTSGLWTVKLKRVKFLMHAIKIKMNLKASMGKGMTLSQRVVNTQWNIQAKQHLFYL